MVHRSKLAYLFDLYELDGVCVCVCALMTREKTTQTRTERDREREKERESDVGVKVLQHISPNIHVMDPDGYSPFTEFSRHEIVAGVPENPGAHFT